MGVSEACRIVRASEADRKSLMRLYTLQKGQEYCPWTESYPAPENITDDLERDALFIMRNGAGEVIASVSIEEDADVDALSCWNPALAPGKEIARLAVDPRYQNRGLARKMVAFIMDVLRNRGYRSIHFLVNHRNLKAIRSYAAFDFRIVGECDLYGQHFLCYEKEL